MAISYHSHHSPIGANASFTVGKFGARGGFGIENGRPADHDIFAGIRKGSGPAMSLHFYQGEEVDISNYLGEGSEEQARKTKPVLMSYPEAQVRRDLLWATDRWTAPGIVFELITPFDSIPDPSLASPEAIKRAVIPAILARLTFDNRDGKEDAVGFFSVGNADKPLHAVDDDTGGKLNGVAYQREWGFAVKAESETVSYLDFSLEDALAKTVPAHFRLGHHGGLLFQLKPGELKTVTVAIGFYHDGIVTTGWEASYYYTRFFNSLEEVLAFAMVQADEMIAAAAARDLELTASRLNEDQKFMLSQATRSYYGNTELLSVDGQPLWVVNEGEYQMMNTFDLTVDMLFYELRWNPWTVRNVLDAFVIRYSYHDQVKHPDEPDVRYPGGISFTHDMGTFNQFSPPGYSSYEMGHLNGCFSYMTHEQLTNWILCASLYVQKTDDFPWLEQHGGIFNNCFSSLLHRDGRVPMEYDGIMNMDSSRCMEGQEITTYDSLDASLGQARNNLYLAGKTWASYICLGHVFHRLGFDTMAQQAEACAALTAATVTKNFIPDEGYIPAVFEAGNNSRIIPAIEGLVFPYLLGDLDAVSDTGRFSDYIRALRQHLKTVLVPGICIDAVNNWWKISSTSNNSWFSKVAISQFAARKILGFDFGPEGLIHDRVHADWQRIGSSEWAMCDQIINGQGYGSKYYPRGVSAILWLEE